MGKKGKKNGKHDIRRIALATATIDLIIHIVDLVSKLLD